MKSGIQVAVEFVGSQSELARRLNVTPQAVQSWVTQGYVPNSRVIEIKNMTGVPAHDLMSPDTVNLLLDAA